MGASSWDRSGGLPEPTHRISIKFYSAAQQTGCAVFDGKITYSMLLLLKIGDLARNVADRVLEVPMLMLELLKLCT